jgi:hypothetical protein
MTPIARQLALAALLAVPAAARAQLLSVRPADTVPLLGQAGVSFTVGKPLNEFADMIRTGFGGTGHLMFNLDRQGILGLRLDAGFLNYGNERVRVCATYVTCRVQVDVTTSNNIVDAMVGPQLTLPSPYIRPYVNAGVGFSYFFTESSVEGSDDTNNPYASTTNYDDGGWSWGGSGGLLIPVSHGRAPISIDLSARYHGNGQRSYLRKGSIRDNGPGQLPTITPMRTQADLVSYHVGVSVGIPRDRSSRDRSNNDNR